MEKILKNLKEEEDWSVFSVFGSEHAEEMIVYSKEQEKRTKALQKETLPMLKGIGFSESESNTMIIGAMAHEGYKEDMTPEGFVGLALRVRGESLTNKD